MLNLYALVNNVYFATKIPGFFIILWLIGLISIGTLKLCLIASFVLFILIPFVFKYSTRLQQGILFLTFIAHPSNSVLKSPHSLGLYATRNFYITHRDPDDEQDIQIGVWHILPNYISKKFSKELNLTESDLLALNSTKPLNKQEEAFASIERQARQEFPRVHESNEREFFERMLQADGSKVFLYLHGNTGSRAAAHRVELYKLLRELGFHILALDYRSYGDSTPRTMSEAGVVRDAITVYKYITNITKNPVFVWGHSLGTGILAHMMAALDQKHAQAPRLAIMESPFSNIRDEIREHPFSKLFRHLPWFDYTIAEPMYANHLRFESDKNIAKFRQPVMILHAQDDLVVPFRLGYKLFRQALDTRNKTWGPVEFHRFEASSQYGHKYIFRAPELPTLVNEFVKSYQNETF